MSVLLFDCAKATSTVLWCCEWVPGCC